MSNPSRVSVSGPLAVFVPGFREDLVRRGYTPGAAAKQLQLTAHVSRWMDASGLDAGHLTAEAVQQFVAERRASGRSRLVSARALGPLLDYLRCLGAAPAQERCQQLTPAELLIERYATYLLELRGLCQSSVRNYVNFAREFLAERERTRGELALEELDPAAVSAFVLREVRRSSVGSAKCSVTRLRSLLRFLHVEGEIGRDLAGAVPRVGSWRLASLVKALDADEVSRLLKSCDQSNAVGARDFAVLNLLARFGLRAGEVTALRVRDIDWRAGEMTIRGKGTRQEQLPLPADVGAALTGWVRLGRPRCAHPFVFTRVRAPHDRLSPTAVTGIVGRACKRAGLPPVGAHRLRHTAATEMLRAGASLSDVGQVLRHRTPDTTSIYAKVDRRALAAVVRPWPGGAA